MKRHGVLRKYSYAWITLLCFLGSLGLHWWFGWLSFADEAQQHGQTPEFSEYLAEMGRDTFENWQSEFLQLLWQVCGLAYFLYVGSPASKENDDRMEAKIDALLRIVGGGDGANTIDGIDHAYRRTPGHAPPPAHGTEVAKEGGSNVKHMAAR